MERRKAALSALFLVTALAAAGCGHDHYYCCGGPSGADPSGIYEGSLTDTVTQQTTPAVAVIDENGDGRMMAQSGTYYRFNQVNTSGYSVFSNVLVFPGNGSTIQGSLNGALTQAGLSATIKASGSDTQSLSLNFDNNYFLSSSLPTLAGSWTYTSSSFSLNLSIQSGGAFTGTDSNNCTYSGYFNLVDPQYNAYSENFTLTCGTASSSYFGLSYFIPAAGTDSNATPAMINFLADDNNGHFVSALLQ